MSARTQSEVIDRIHQTKYRNKGDTYEQSVVKMSRGLGDNEIEAGYFRSLLLNKEFLPAGRVIAKFSTGRETTALNCFVGETIHDSMDGIMRALARSAETLRRGGGIGNDFSSIRPRGHNIASFDSPASGPVSFMGMWEHMARTIASAGNRRGAMMGTLRCDHPDIFEFIRVKAQNPNPFMMFNLSVLCTSEFMYAVQYDQPFALRWNVEVVKYIQARELWEEMMQLAYLWGDPGVLFIDNINYFNNLKYCETISATNPCGEQPLPPNGACLLGSINLTQHIAGGAIDWSKLIRTTKLAVRMLNRVIDKTSYPLPEQEWEEKNKRRMGIGVMGVANALEYVTGPYGSPEFLKAFAAVMNLITVTAYKESMELAKGHGPFPLFDSTKYLESPFIARCLPEDLIHSISIHGVRNSHLVSIAPTGSLSLLCGNISSGIEPVFSEYQDRKILFEGSDVPETHRLHDFGVHELGVKPKVAKDVTIEEHLGVLEVAQRWSDSGVSKTINCSQDVPYEEFKDIYMAAYDRGAKGCTVYRSGCMREGILSEAQAPAVETGDACYIDPETGRASCG